ncbi:MAG: SAM-dependent chlorinase/fluorinase [Kiritimatiellae bacterium]|nr:SAM-dependent chlorinase/fluorinase [Kiritimatiellia bacterium]
MARPSVRRPDDRCPVGPWITLLTDFGDSDSYVAAMKGVLAARAPLARVADAAHEIPRGDIRAGAWVLSQYWRWWPEGTVHVAVVDPGVGTSRAAVLARADRRWLIAPDNGLLSGVAAAADRFEAWRLRPTAGAEIISSTFHGRDLFAVVAARLVAGESWRRLVERRWEITRLREWGRPERDSAGKVRGWVLHVDRFGNAITSLEIRDLPAGRWRLRAGTFRACRLHRTYGDVAPGRPLVYLGSAGRLELAVRDASAAERYGLRPGMWVVVRPAGQLKPRATERKQ